MHCTQCGKEFSQFARYCSGCGQALTDNAPQAPSRLSRPREGKWVAGVCAAVARNLDVDVSLVRIVWILLTVLPPLPGIIVYLVCWIVIPKDPPVEARQEPRYEAPASVQLPG